MKIKYHFAAGLWAGVFAAIAPSAIARDQIRTYSVPKEHPDAAAAAPAMAGSDVPVASFKNAPVQWTVPSEWKTLPANAVRIGNFAVEKDGKKAEITVVPFPGAVGVEVDNVNRWRQQAGLPAITQEEIVWKPVSVDGSDGRLYDLAGSTDSILVASVSHDGNTWFFKMRGEKDLVDSQRGAFMDFLKSVRFNTSAPAVPSDSSGDLPKWNVPANWLDKPAGPMVLKSFSVPGDTGQPATVSISMLSGEGGGVFANVNRWRGQLGLGPVDSDQLSKITDSVDASGGKGVIVDFAGTGGGGQPARLVAAIVPHGGNTWFYKFVGENALIEREKTKFVHFVETVQYP